MMRTLLVLMVLIAPDAMARSSPPAGAGQGAGHVQHTQQEADRPAPAQGPSAPTCPQPLQSGCLAQQSSCQIACPPQWSTNPGAPAFTTNDRTGCLRTCLNRYLSCMRLHGCM